jgi:hypothetical protein
VAQGPALKGPQKARRLPLLVTTSQRGFRLFDYRLRELFERADIISEGARKATSATVEADNTYFGTTNIVLTPYASDTSSLAIEPQLLVRIFAWDPHVRLRALRIAYREARVRANGVIDRVRTEIVVSQAPLGIRIHVDLEARVLSTSPRSLGSSLTSTNSVHGPRATRRVI